MARCCPTRPAGTSHAQVIRASKDLEYILEAYLGESADAAGCCPCIPALGIQSVMLLRGIAQHGTPCLPVPARHVAQHHGPACCPIRPSARRRQGQGAAREVHVSAAPGAKGKWGGASSRGFSGALQSRNRQLAWGQAARLEQRKTCCPTRSNLRY